MNIIVKKDIFNHKFKLSIDNIIDIIQDVYDTSALKDEGYFNSEDVIIALKRINKFDYKY
jgi:hypothetical protein